MKKRRLLQYAALVAGVQSFPTFATTPPQFTSRVYFVIHESSPSLVQRGRRVIEQEFAESYQGMPQLHGRPYQVFSDGNQVVFSMVADADMRSPFQNVVAQIVGQLNGRVRTRGGFDLLKTSMTESPERYLEVILDETNTKIRSIVARTVALRDLLAELKLQFGDSVLGQNLSRFSYMIPGECASKQIDWSFGSSNPEDKVAAKTLDEALQELARFFHLSVTNHKGTYIFAGECPRTPSVRAASSSLEFLPSRWITLPEAMQVMPVAPPPPSLPSRPPTVPVNLVE